MDAWTGARSEHLHHSGGLDTEDTHAARLREYYMDSWFDYRFLWLDPRTRAMHFGYGHRTGRRHSRSLLRMNAVMADAAGLQPNHRVLDAGCGVGGTALWLAERHGVEVVGINLVEDHVERARRYTIERGLGGNPTFEVRDYCATGFPAASFDVVWATESACHAPDKRAFTAEAWRLLRPGGRLVMAEYVVDEAQLDHPTIREWDSMWEMHLADAPTWFASFDSAGFRGVELRDATAEVHGSLRRLRRLCRALGPIAALLHRLHVRTDAQQRNIRGSNAMWAARRADVWRYAIMTATKPSG